MFASRILGAVAVTAATMAIPIVGSPPRAAAALPAADSVFILQGASPDAWAPEILGRIDPWATGGQLGRAIDANYYHCSSGCTVSEIPYPRTAGPVFGPNAPFADQSIAIGVDLTEKAIHDADGQVVVAGLSLGSMTADAVQRSLDANPGRRPPAQMTFIVSGDPSRVTPFSTGIGAFFPPGFRIPVVGWTANRPPSDSAYDTVVVVGEYDVTADFPDRPWNLLALANGILGFDYTHGASSLSSPSEVPPQNIRVTTNAKGGTTTTYLWPSPVLPMLRPLTGVLPESVIDGVNSVLKPIVDRAYSRNDAITGNRLPYLQPTDGLPRLVMPAPVAPTKPVVTQAVPKLLQPLTATRDTAVRSSKHLHSRPTSRSLPASTRDRDAGSALSSSKQPSVHVRDGSADRVKSDKSTSEKKQDPRRHAARTQRAGGTRTSGPVS